MKNLSFLLVLATFSVMAMSFRTGTIVNPPNGRLSHSLGKSGKSLKAEESPMLWETTQHNFGVVKQNQPVSFEFVFTNNSNEPMILTKVKPSCGCTATNYPEEPIAPGESASIKATYNAKAMGKFKKTILVNTNTPYAEGLLTISGEVK